MTLIRPCPTCRHYDPHTPDSTAPIAWCHHCRASCPTEPPRPGPTIELGDPEFGTTEQTPAYADDTWAATAPRI